MDDRTKHAEASSKLVKAKEGYEKGRIEYFDDLNGRKKGEKPAISYKTCSNKNLFNEVSPTMDQQQAQENGENKPTCMEQSKENQGQGGLGQIQPLQTGNQEGQQAYHQYTNKIVSEDNTKNLWRLMKSNNDIYNDSKGKANILNDQFCSVFTR